MGNFIVAILVLSLVVFVAMLFAGLLLVLLPDVLEAVKDIKEAWMELRKNGKGGVE